MINLLWFGMSVAAVVAVGAGSIRLFRCGERIGYAKAISEYEDAKEGLATLLRSAVDGS